MAKRGSYTSLWVSMVEEQATARIKIYKAITRFAVVMLIIIVLALAFIYFSPDYDMRLIIGSSMKPVINTLDIVVTRLPGSETLEQDVKVGTIISFKVGIGMVLHRVTSIQGDVIMTQGDAIEGPDPWQLTLSEVKGVYLFKIPRIFLLLAAFIILIIYRELHQVKTSEVMTRIIASAKAKKI